LETELDLEVPVSVLSKALNKLEVVEINLSNIGLDHALEFFRQMSRETNLKTVFLYVEETYPSIPAKILSRGINKLESFIAFDIQFTSFQLKTILDDMAKDSSKLKKLRIQYPQEDLPV